MRTTAASSPSGCRNCVRRSTTPRRRRAGDCGRPSANASSGTKMSKSWPAANAKPASESRITAPPYIVAHDTGTGGDKAILTDLRGRVLHACYQPYPVIYPRPEWAEQDPEVLWSTVAATTRRVIEAAGVDPGDILGVGISAQMFNLLPVDESGRALSPMLSWLGVGRGR